MNLAKPARRMRSVEDPPDRTLGQNLEFDLRSAIARRPVLLDRQCARLFPNGVQLSPRYRTALQIDRFVRTAREKTKRLAF